MGKICAILVSLALVAFASVFMAYSEKPESTTAAYSCVFHASDDACDVVPGSPADMLHQAVLMEFDQLMETYEKEWDYTYNDSVPYALKSQDVMAVAYCEDVAKALREKKEQFDIISSSKKWGEGSFSVTIRFQASRSGHDLDDSSDITFSYDGNKQS